jgi:hypothetical protein
MATKTKQGVTTAPSPLGEGAAAPPRLTWWQKHWQLAVPIAFTAVVASIVVTGVVVMPMGGSGDNVSTSPASPTDLSAEASAKAEAPPKIEFKGATFTPGTYTVEQVSQFSAAECQRDAAKVVACFLAANYKGDLKRLASLLDPTDLKDADIAGAKEFRQAFTEDDLILAGFKFNVLWRTAEGSEAKLLNEGPFTSEWYAVRVQMFSNPPGAEWDQGSTGIKLFLTPEGKWMFTGQVEGG